jgi:ferredoxin
MALSQKILTSLVDLKAEQLDFVEGRCTRFRHRNSECRKCVEACSSGALRIEDKAVEIEPALCLSCGSCATACPTKALRIHDPSLNELMKAGIDKLKVADEPIYACRQVLEEYDNAYDPEQLIVCECLADLDEGVLLTLLAAGAPVVKLICSDCAGCPKARARATIDVVLDLGRRLASHYGFNGERFQLINGLPDELVFSKKEVKARRKAALAESKRAMFGGLKESSKGAAAHLYGDLFGKVIGEDAAQDLQEQKRLESKARFDKFDPLRELQVNVSLRALSQRGGGEGRVEESAGFATRLWSTIDIDLDKCSYCQICCKVCPTGAITTYAEDGGRGLDFQPAICTQCHLCQDICFPKALTVAPQVDLDDVLEENILRFELREGRSQRQEGIPEAPSKQDMTFANTLTGTLNGTPVRLR